MVPSGWKKGLVSDLADTVMGYAFKSNDFVKEGIPLVRMGNLYQNQFQLDRSPIYLPDDFAIEYRKFLLQSGDLVMSMTGTMGKRDYGFAVEIPENTQDCLLNQRVLKIEPRNSDAKGFVLNVLKSEIFLSKLYSLPGGTKQANLSATQIREISVLIPPLPEQQKIANILSTWDKAISTTERLIENSTQQKKALMQQLLTGKKRLLDESGERFEGECGERKLSNLGSTFNGLTGKTKVDFGSGKKYIPYMNIFKNTFIDTDNLDYVNVDVDEKQNTVQFGDVFFTTSSETPEEVGMSSVLLKKTKEPIYLNSFCFGFRLFEIDKVTPAFIGYILRSSHVRRKIAILAQGATRYNLSKVQLLKISIALPSLEEQQKIATVLTNADREIELLEQQLADLQQEKKALMQVLLTGKKRVVVDGEG